MPEVDSGFARHGPPTVDNAEYMLSLRAVRWVRMAYGLQSPFQWRPFHDRVALKALDKLRRGEALPQVGCAAPPPLQLDPRLPTHMQPMGFQLLR